LSELMVWASARSANIFSAVSATILSLSATAFPSFHFRLFVRSPICRAASARANCALFLHLMMRKSHRHDKR
jgi:hypothetical protein